ncbi:MFS transporter [Microbacterium sp. ARD32]|uniref:MFS transporter n=1 Tax=Microbacterium sp. ARD32 TaxID=2962577 RepID=UPI002880DC5C|nr:MFS transporter [Microbacterium sp. ARD32]MDT0157366.1 MFS transporter [Microbacterium sp. ARD32]
MSTPAPPTIWDRSRLGITVGTVVLIFLAALEALAVTTVMPVVADDLDGEALFAVAFSATLATGVIGMVASGAWSDSGGPRPPLYTAVALFAVGLLVSGLALDMYTFIAGRLIQGLGAGGQTVALYVVVARLYPPQLHGRIFAAYAAAWVVPSMVGPFLAGAVTEFLHWRWAFLGVAVLTVAAFALVAVRLRGVSLAADAGDPGRTGEPASDSGEPASAPVVTASVPVVTASVPVAPVSVPVVPEARAGRARRRVGVAVRLLLAVLVAVCAVSVGFAADLPAALGGPGTGAAIAVVAIMVIGVALLPLLPVGSLRAASGLPSVVLMRAIAAGAFFAAEAYVPRLLIDRFEFSPTVAGLALTLSALGWSGASAVQGRYGDLLGSARIVTLSTVLMAVGFSSALAVSILGADPWIVVTGWFFAGAGMGLLYPRLTVLTLAYSTTADEGFNSSALSIADSTGSAVLIAVAGLGFVLLPIGGSGYITVYLLAIGLLLLALLPGLRMGDGRR